MTLLMFPILVTMYVRLAYREEGDALAEFGETYARYAAVTLHSSRGVVATPKESYLIHKSLIMTHSIHHSGENR